MIPEPIKPPALVKTSTALPSFTQVSASGFCCHAAFLSVRYLTCEISLSKTHGKPCKSSRSSFAFKNTRAKSFMSQVIAFSRRNGKLNGQRRAVSTQFRRAAHPRFARRQNAQENGVRRAVKTIFERRNGVAARARISAPHGNMDILAGKRTLTLSWKL